MTFPAVGNCTCQSPARCPRVDLCATELVVDLLVADPAPFISRCDVTLRCMRPELGAATQCPGPCPVDDRAAPTPYNSGKRAFRELVDAWDAMIESESGPGLTT